MRIYTARFWPPPWNMPPLDEAGTVRGVRHDDGTTIWFGWIHALPPSAGHGGRYLDSLPRSKRIVMTAVISPVLRGMLERRGFYHERVLFVTPGGEPVDGWLRDPVN